MIPDSNRNSWRILMPSAFASLSQRFLKCRKTQLRWSEKPDGFGILNMNNSNQNSNQNSDLFFFLSQCFYNVLTLTSCSCKIQKSKFQEILLKVNKFQNQFMKSSFLPKYEPKIVRIYACSVVGTLGFFYHPDKNLDF